MQRSCWKKRDKDSAATEPKSITRMEAKIDRLLQEVEMLRTYLHPQQPRVRTATAGCEALPVGGTSELELQGPLGNRRWGVSKNGSQATEMAAGQFEKTLGLGLLMKLNPESQFAGLTTGTTPTPEEKAVRSILGQVSLKDIIRDVRAGLNGVIPDKNSRSLVDFDGGVVRRIEIKSGVEYVYRLAWDADAIKVDPLLKLKTERPTALSAKMLALLDWYSERRSASANGKALTDHAA